MNYSLCGDDILKLLKGKTKIIIYPELEKYKNIDELLSPYGSVVILYLTEKIYGHWVALIKHKTHIEHFDSYAIIPDGEFNFIDKPNRRKYNFKNRPYLTKLLYNSGYKIEYNHKRLQNMDDDIATCGRHAALRILLKDIPMNDYINIMTSVRNMSPDEIVLKLTSI